MNSHTSFGRLAAISAIVSGPLALGASALVATAVISFDFEAMAEPTALISLGERAAQAFRWAEFLGMWGYYLLLVPAAIYLWQWLRHRSPGLVTMYTIIGLAHIFIGAIGSAILVAVIPSLMETFSQAMGPQRQVSIAVFEAFSDLAIVSLFKLESILSGIWWLGIGAVLRSERGAFGVATMVLGLGFLAYGVGNLLQLEAFAVLEPLTFLSPIWAMWLGVVILRGASERERAIEVAMVA